MFGKYYCFVSWLVSNSHRVNPHQGCGNRSDELPRPWQGLTKRTGGIFSWLESKTPFHSTQSGGENKIKRSIYKAKPRLPRTVCRWVTIHYIKSFLRGLRQSLLVVRGFKVKQSHLTRGMVLPNPKWMDDDDTIEPISATGLHSNALITATVRSPDILLSLSLMCFQVTRLSKFGCKTSSTKWTYNYTFDDIISNRLWCKSDTQSYPESPKYM